MPDPTWPVSIRTTLDQRIVDALAARGATYVSGHTAAGAGGVPGPQTMTFHVVAPTGEAAARIVQEVLDLHFVDVGTFAVQSTPVEPL